MLSVYLGDLDDCMNYPDIFFETAFDFSYLLDDFSRRAIKVIDKSEVFDKNVIISPVLGGISPRDLSSGVKNVLISRFYPEEVICFSHMGKNCLPVLFDEIVKNNLDRTMCADILYVPYTYGYKGDIKILNTGDIVKNSTEFFDVYFDLEVDM